MTKSAFQKYLPPKLYVLVLVLGSDFACELPTTKVIGSSSFELKIHKKVTKFFFKLTL